MLVKVGTGCTPGHRLSIRITTEYRNSHRKDKTVLWPSYLSNGNPIRAKDSLISNHLETVACMTLWQWSNHMGNDSDVIMSAIASQISSVMIVCSTVCWSPDQRKHQSSASLAFVRGIHRWPVDSPHKGPVTRKMFPLDDVNMREPT